MSARFLIFTSLPSRSRAPKRLTSSMLPTLPDELWHAIFRAERQSWRRLRMCMVCNAWLRAIRDDPETWRALVLTHDRWAVLDLPADEFVRRMVDDGALPILATHVRRLVPDLSWVTTVVLEGRTLPGFSTQPRVSGTLERRYFEVAWPVLSALCELAFPSLRKLAVDLAALVCHSCDNARLDVVFRWLRDGLPSGLEVLNVEEVGLLDKRLQEWQQTHQQGLLDRYVHLKGLHYFKYEPLPEACFDPDGMQQTLEVLDWSDWFNHYDPKHLASFEKLRLLQIVMDAPIAEDLANLCEAVPASVKVLYLSWDSSKPFSLVEWSVLGVLRGLVELCVCLDACDFTEGEGPAVLTSHLAQLLPKTTILIAKAVGRTNGTNEIEGSLEDISDRDFLPLCVPDWHRVPGIYQPPVKS